MTQKQVFKRDNVLVDIIREHIGSENAISTEQLSKILNEKGYSTKSSSIHIIVARLIKERYLPICSINSKGYYFPKNKKDIEIAISHLQSRADELQSRVDFLKQFLF